MRHAVHVLLVVCAVTLPTISDRSLAKAADGPVVATAAVANDTVQEDFPAMCLDQDGSPWVVYVEYDNQADRLKIAKKTSQGMEVLGALAGPGLIHRPTVACDGKGAIWAVWSELDERLAWHLNARQIVDGKIQPDVVTLEGASGSAIFADAGTDAQGRVWVTWQSFRNALGDVFAKHFDPATGKWSEEIRVTSNEAGDWEPRLAFTKDGATWIVFDSSRGDTFNVYLAKVAPDGKTEITPLSKSPRYQGRPSIAATPDGRGLWVAWENGRLQWGRNTRGVGGTIGLNGDKRIDVVYYDVASGQVTPAANVTAVLKKAAAAPAPAAPKKQPGKKPAKNAGGAVQALNLPAVVTDGQGNLWLAARYYVGANWKIALTKYDPGQKTWTQPVTLANSTLSQDRRCSTARDAKGRLWLAWPSDLRTTKRALKSGVYLAQIDPAVKVPVAQVAPPKARAVPAEPVPKWGDDTPERARDDHHVWTAGGKKYGLYFGDFHRHTDISNCRTAHDGCIVEQFRYAYDVARLDLLGTSDHTDVGKPYDPYEWWCDQKLADVFFVPGFFTSMYVYEREQRWPWGHRNVIFTQRGGPIIYINRGLYKSMPWDAMLPAAEGGPEILPQELWKLLRKNAMPVTIISHTGATGMGTDWDGYKQIDNAVENLVEIYQGARVSYEGVGTPQPTVGFPKGKQLAEDAHGSVKTGVDFGKYNKGVYQNALQNGYKLGAFANSDHIATHTSFGGVYAESFTREGILDGLNARRTFGATDKIFVEFSCDGHLLGTVFDVDKPPALTLAVFGTAPLRRVTIVRNEVNCRVFTPDAKQKDLEATFTDPAPIEGENRYYLRVEQVDGNMAWTSPVWVTYTKK